MKPEQKSKWGIFGSLMLTANVLVLLALILSYLAGSISPDKFWPLAFVGMTYPLLLIATLFFTVYWLLKRKWFLFLNVALILAKWDYVQETIQLNRPAENNSDGIKVMSFNVRMFDRFNWIEGSDTEKSIYSFLKYQQPDVLCIQEFFVGTKTGVQHCDELLRLESLGFVHLEKSNEKFATGIATFSRYPIVSKGVVFHDKEHNNMGIYTDLLIEADTVRVYNIHLQSIGLQDKDYALLDQLLEDQVVGSGTERKQFIRQMIAGFKKRATQADVVSEHLRQSPFAIILGGDFNDVPTSYAYQIIHRGLKDSFSQSGMGFGATYVRLPIFRIDNIFHDEHFVASDHQVHQQVLSDHYAITSVLQPVN